NEIRAADVPDQRRDTLWEPGVAPSPYKLTPDVPLYHVTVSPTLPPVRPLVVRIEELLAPARDPSVRRLEAHQLPPPGRHYLADDTPRAAALFEAALLVRPGDAAASVDLAVVRARTGDFKGALALVEAVLAREPGRVVARVNAGRYRMQLG